jgi:hypothetical protein
MGTILAGGRCYRAGMWGAWGFDAISPCKLESVVMQLFVATLLFAVSAVSVSRAAERGMTHGLTNQRPDGMPGATYQGGVVDYAGPR